jgi:hypothetical protein
MKPIERLPSLCFGSPEMIASKQSEIIKRVNELSEQGEKTNKELDTIYTALERLDDKKDSTPKRFKAEDVIVSRHGFSPEEWSLVGFKTQAEAQAALEALLNL